MASGFDKIIGILKKTGDNCIIVDEQGNPQYMVMPFDRYESLISIEKAPESAENDWKSTETENRIDDWEDLAEIQENQSKKEEKEVNKAKNLSAADTGDKQYFFEPID